ncbi:MAG: PhzF family phenazine biosynthesis protein [Clostridiales bacterium]|nr:PhzF family phenazine biosynthesis protein [Clostridiales bacterium]
MNAYIINSFVHEEKGGNPAGVVILGEHDMTEATMKTIASHLGLSETAFIMPCDDKPDYQIRFFTPTEEVPLCGHATLASAYMLYRLGVIKKNEILQRTAAGDLEIKLIVDSGHVIIMMRQAEPEKIKLSNTDVLRIKKCFHSSDPEPFHESFPIEVWSTGLKDLMIGVKNRETLNTLALNFKEFSALSDELGVVGAHVFTVESGNIFARNFAPLYGIDEEAATGTSNGALAAYLHHHLHSAESSFDATVLQGESMNATSSITVRSHIDSDHHEIWVGGVCHWVKTIDLHDLI